MSHVLRIRCDNCGTETEFPHFGAWWRLGVRAPGTVVEDAPLDFCNQQCLRAWVIAAGWTDQETP